MFVGSTNTTKLVAVVGSEGMWLVGLGVSQLTVENKSWRALVGKNVVGGGIGVELYGFVAQTPEPTLYWLLDLHLYIRVRWAHTS